MRANILMIPMGQEPSDAVGCMGKPTIYTPHLDAIAGDWAQPSFLDPPANGRSAPLAGAMDGILFVTSPSTIECHYPPKLPVVEDQHSQAVGNARKLLLAWWVRLNQAQMKCLRLRLFLRLMNVNEFSQAFKISYLI